MGAVVGSSCAQLTRTTPMRFNPVVRRLLAQLTEHPTIGQPSGGAAGGERGRRTIEPVRRGRLKRLSTCPRDAAILQVASRVFAARSSLRRGARRRRRASWNDARRTGSSRGGGLPSGRRLAPYPPSFWLHGAVTVPAGDPARDP